MQIWCEDRLVGTMRLPRDEQLRAVRLGEMKLTYKRIDLDDPFLDKFGVVDLDAASTVIDVEIPLAWLDASMKIDERMAQFEPEYERRAMDKITEKMLGSEVSNVEKIRSVSDFSFRIKARWLVGVVPIETSEFLFDYDEFQPV